MKVILGNLGQYGDSIINTVLARAFKQRHPNSHVTLQIAQKFSQIAPLFSNHPYIDRVKIFEGYDNFPTQNDLRYLQEERFDFIFPGMPPAYPYWYNLVNHQTQAICIINGLAPPQNLQCILNKYFDHKPGLENTIAVSFFSGKEKSISIDKAQKIVDFIHSLGYSTIHLNGPNEPDLINCPKSNTSYFDSVKTLLGCKLFVTIDTGMSWVASAYSFPVVGMYGKIYPRIQTQKVYEPVNPEAIYLERDVANDIPLEEITKAIKNKLSK